MQTLKTIFPPSSTTPHMRRRIPQDSFQNSSRPSSGLKKTPRLSVSQETSDVSSDRRHSSEVPKHPEDAGLISDAHSEKLQHGRPSETIATMMSSAFELIASAAIGSTATAMASSQCKISVTSLGGDIDPSSTAMDLRTPSRQSVASGDVPAKRKDRLSTTKRPSLAMAIAQIHGANILDFTQEGKPQQQTFGKKQSSDSGAFCDTPSPIPVYTDTRESVVSKPINEQETESAFRMPVADDIKKFTSENGAKIAPSPVIVVETSATPLDSPPPEVNIGNMSQEVSVEQVNEKDIEPEKPRDFIKTKARAISAVKKKPVAPVTDRGRPKIRAKNRVVAKSTSKVNKRDARQTKTK